MTMVEIGSRVDNFEAPMVKGEQEGEEFTLADTINVEGFTLEDVLGDGPIVLAFFPGVYTPVCRDELCEFRDSYEEFVEFDARVYGISVDTPFAQNQFINDYELNFPLLSDRPIHLIEEFDVVYDEFTHLEDLGYKYDEAFRIPKRSVFVLDEEGNVTYKWVSDDPTNLPDIDEIKEAVGDTH